MASRRSKRSGLVLTALAVVGLSVAALSPGASAATTTTTKAPAPTTTTKAPAPTTTTVAPAPTTTVTAAPTGDPLEVGVSSDGSLERAPAVAPPSDPFHLASLPAAKGGPKSVIGSDTRARVDTSTYPGSATVQVWYQGQPICSGAMVGPDTVLLAGHCVASAKGTWRDKGGYAVYPGRNGALTPWGSCGVRVEYTVKGWFFFRNPDYDYGALKLDCSIGNVVGWYGFFWSNHTLTSAPATIQGYPTDKVGALANTQWTASGKLTFADTRRLYFTISTSVGQTGGPIWTPLGAPFVSVAGPYIMGINAYQQYGSTNSGTRIAEPVFNNVVNWSNAP
ncbi:MAG: trypsin-like serine protease [Actinomycetes bacterium]